MRLAVLVCALVDGAIERRCVRVNTYGTPPIELLAFHWFRATWPPSRRMTWRPYSPAN